MERTEEIWAGKFGNEYHLRNKAVDRTELWRAIMEHVQPFPKNAIELGAGKGENLSALKALGVNDIVGVEVNPQAALVMRESSHIQVWQEPISRIETLGWFDMAIVRGVLIHMTLPQLDHAMALLHTAAKHVVMIEYCAPFRRHIRYQGKDELLWADDYPARFMERSKGYEWKLQILESDPLNTTTCVFTRQT